MQNPEWRILRLVERTGCDRADIEARVAQDDLWLLEAESRYILPAREWEGASAHLMALADVYIAEPAIQQALMDAALRCEEAAQRAS